MMSLKRFKMEAGGGGIHGVPEVAKTLFIPQGVNHVQRRKDARSLRKMKNPSISENLSETNDPSCQSHHVAADARHPSDKRTDQTGIFDGSCSHEVIEAVIDMTAGEKRVLPDTMLQHFKSRLPDNTELLCCYDIPCTYSSHVALTNETMPSDQKLLPGPKIYFLPAMHAYGHDQDCQTLFSPRKICGVGSFDGEGHERTHSFLTNFVSFTVRMTSENRENRRH